MKYKQKEAYRDAAVRGIPFFCGGHTIQAVPFDDLSGEDGCDLDDCKFCPREKENEGGTDAY